MGSRRKKSIGIIGGGIGGVAAAVALHQVGFDVSIYDREERLREAGAGMMLWPNATRVLRGLGVLEKVLSRSGRNTHFLVRTSSGRTLMTIALGKFEVPRFACVAPIFFRFFRAPCRRTGFTSAANFVNCVNKMTRCWCC
jgi:2-polyprenyl-6-methoxyphenol hydroxylase-like FAD-dependent oxidoreductase